MSDKNEQCINKVIADDKSEMKFHWNVSANILCNYMKKQDYLDKILRNKAIIPRYVIEPLEYLHIENLNKICFPMTCFCDIPFSRLKYHVSNYGEYGIGFYKERFIKKKRLQPIQYISFNSPLLEDFRSAFNFALDYDFDNKYSLLADFLASELMFMKPLIGNDAKCGNNYVYQDECEWRFIPIDFFSDLDEQDNKIDLIYTGENANEFAKGLYNSVLEKHKECWLDFDWEDISYIIVPNDIAVEHTIETIKHLRITDDDKYKLISKIENSKCFNDNI